MNTDAISEHTYLDARINRAYVRMQKAKDSKWYDRWAEAFIASNSARNAIANVQKVRFPARDRESGAGTRPLAFGCVSDLEGQSTTSFVDSPLGEK